MILPRRLALKTQTLLIHHQRCLSAGVQVHVRPGKTSLEVNKTLYQAVNATLTGTGVSKEVFWTGLEGALNEFSPKNAELLLRRDSLQKELNYFHKVTPVAENMQAYKGDLKIHPCMRRGCVSSTLYLTLRFLPSRQPF